MWFPMGVTPGHAGWRVQVTDKTMINRDVQLVARSPVLPGFSMRAVAESSLRNAIAFRKSNWNQIEAPTA